MIIQIVEDDKLVDYRINRKAGNGIDTGLFCRHVHKPGYGRKKQLVLYFGMFFQVFLNCIDVFQDPGIVPVSFLQQVMDLFMQGRKTF